MFRPVLKDAPQARGRDAAQGEKSSKSTPTEPESSSHQEAGGGQRTEKGRSSNASSYLQGQRPACSRKTKNCSGVSSHDRPCDKDTKSGRSVEESNFPTTPKPKDWCTVETGGDFSGRRGDLGVPRSVNGCSAGSPCQSLNGQKLDNKEGSARSELGIFQRLPCIPLSTLPHWGDVGVDLAIPSAKIALERVPQMSKATDSISKGSRLVAGATATLVNLQNEMKPRRVQNTSTVHNRQLVFGLIFDDGVLCSSNERPLETIVKLPPWIYDPNDRPAKGLHEPRSLEGTMHRSAARISSHNTNGKNSGSFDGCAVEEVSLDSCQDEEFRLILANQTRQQEEVAKASETTFQISFDFLRRMCE
ncbi:hypothetical protein BSKO_08396 [Bryopsis sp. KO-2023]|nr:hypothetical protein BSKO_08396 [Bryopsis sp. KO-2023]